MAETKLTLFIDLEQGAHIDLDAASNAALAWSELIRAVGQDVDPFVEWQIELESSLPGSLKIRSIIRLVNTPEMRGAIVGAVVTSLIFLFKETVAWGVGEVMNYLKGSDAPSEVSTLSEEELHKIAVEIANHLNRGAGRSVVPNVYEALKKDGRVQGVGVTSSPTRRPAVVVPRDSFPTITETDGEKPKESRTTTERVELTLIRPILTSDPSRRWGFHSAYGSFGAPVKDQEFLRSLAEGTLNVPLSQGIRMLVDIEITSQNEDGVWRPVERSITKVIEVIAPPRQESLNLSGPE